MAKKPAWIAGAGTLGGAIVSTLSYRLPGLVQDIGLGIGLALMAISIIGYAGYALYWWRNRSGAHKPIAEPSFQIERDERETLTGDYERFFALAIKNIEPTDLEACCLVQIEKFSATPAATTPIPFVLRTDGQIQGKRRGRFNLSAGQTKTIPVLFRNPHRRNEWFLFDEHGKRHFVPAQGAQMIIGVYGGKRNSSVQVGIDLGREWATNFSLKADH